MRRWRELLQGRPGTRFTDQYERRHSERSGKLGALLSELGGTLLILLGLLLGPTPGPGFIFVLLGAAILAGRSRAFARALDRWEVRIRRLRKRRG